MPTELFGILTQIPIVGVFIWFVLEWSRRNQASMDERDGRMQAFLREQREHDRIILQELISILRDHDRKTDDAITRMEERTRPRNSRRGKEATA